MQQDTETEMETLQSPCSLLPRYVLFICASGVGGLSWQWKGVPGFLYE